MGDIATWWAGVRAAVRNEHARTDAKQELIEAITDTAVALQEAGSPGISVLRGPRQQVLHGWWLTFTWSDLPGVTQLMTPPDIPVGHLRAGEWDYDLHLPHQEFFTGRYFAYVAPERVGNSDYTRDTWRKRGIEEFTDALFPAWLTYRVSYQKDIRTRITDHTDPAIYVPYVNAVAQRAAAAFQAMVPGRWTGPSWSPG